MLSCGEPPFGDPGKEQLCGKAWCGSPSLTFSCSICFYSSFYFEGKKGPPVGTLLDITANFHIPVTRFTSCQPLAVLALLFLLSHGQHHCDHCFLLYCFLISLKVLRGMCSFLSLRCQHYVPERRHSPTQPHWHRALVTSPSGLTVGSNNVLHGHFTFQSGFDLPPCITSAFIWNIPFLSEPFSFISSAFCKSAVLDFHELPLYLSLSTGTQLSVCLFGNPGFLEINFPVERILPF